MSGLYKPTEAMMCSYVAINIYIQSVFYAMCFLLRSIAFRIYSELRLMAKQLKFVPYRYKMYTVTVSALQHNKQVTDKMRTALPTRVYRLKTG